MKKPNAKADQDAVIRGEHRNPFGFLGPHRDRATGDLIIRAFLPEADSAQVLASDTGKVVAAMRKVDPAGFYTATIKSADKDFRYRLRLKRGADTWEQEDAFRFGSAFGELDSYFLAEGTHYRSFEKLGAHPCEIDHVEGVAFAVWAPNASRVSVVGDFNGWDGRRHPMRLHPGCGVWEIFMPGLKPGTCYKYEIKGPHGELLPLKADPYAFQAEVPPRTASVVAAPSRHAWRDQEWMATREGHHQVTAAISIYEVHLGSWQRVPEEGGRSLNYRELAERLVPYVRDMGFTHIELLPISEHPFDGSWGYQPIGLYAPTSRFGDPDDFRALVDACHQNGIGVILDWVPGHFPEDAHGLAWFDGTALYEHADPRQGRHQDWGTLIYNYGRAEVTNFLISNALYWLERFHIDGLRVDAVASMLYLDYSREHGQWVPNQFGGNENLEAIAFIKRLNEVVYGQHSGAFTMAEESTAWPMVSRPTYLGGLGFGFKWNMGWMHDTLGYIGHDPIHRRYHHNALTFGLLYAFQENFVLPLSHDEVVHGKGSILGRMPGDKWQKVANLRAYYAFMWTHPGKKLLFMGSEFGQEREWNHDDSLDWHLCEDPLHQGAKSLLHDLNSLYRRCGALHQRDFDPEGFSWIDCNDHDQSVLSYLRRGFEPGDLAVVVCNFTPVVREGYRVGVPVGGFWHEALNTDALVYGGSGIGNLGGAKAEEVPVHGFGQSVSLTLPPLAVLVLRPSGLA